MLYDTLHLNLQYNYNNNKNLVKTNIKKGKHEGG